MTDYKIQLSKEALKNLSSLPRGIKNRIMDKLSFYECQEDPLKFAKKLTGFGKKTFRFRVGDYRVIFRTDKNGEIVVLLVLKIAHRREAY